MEIKPITVGSSILYRNGITLGDFKEALKLIRDRFGEVFISFFQSDKSEFDADYTNEKYLNGTYQCTTDGSYIVLNESCGVFETLDNIDSLLVLLDNIDKSHIPYGDNTYVQLGNLNRPSTLVDMFVCNSQLYLITSTQGINWNTREESIFFNSQIVSWMVTNLFSSAESSEYEKFYGVY